MHLWKPNPRQDCQQNGKLKTQHRTLNHVLCLTRQHPSSKHCITLLIQCLLVSCCVDNYAHFIQYCEIIFPGLLDVFLFVYFSLLHVSDNQICFNIRQR